MLSWIAKNKQMLIYAYHLTPSWLLTPGGRLNKKDGLTRYGDSHVKDKTS